MYKALLSFIILIGGCSMTPEKYSNQEPKMDFKEYFNGPVQAWGIVQDWKGDVLQRFDIDMEGVWNGNEGELRETFHFYDGQTMKRKWYVTKVNDTYYEGKADDVLNTATGHVYGNAIRFNYQMELPMNGKKYKVALDDWMFRMNDGVLINRNYIKKFGFKVAEFTIFMKKKN